MANRIRLNNVRMSFMDRLFEPKQYQGAGPFRYGCNFLLEPGSPADLLLRETIKTALLEKFDGNQSKADKAWEAWRNNNQKCCYQDGNTQSYAGYEDMWYLAANSTVAPGVYDADRTPLEKGRGRPYSGCYVNAIVEIYIQTGSNAGIRCGLSGVQFASDGDAFAGGAPARAADFDALAAGADDGGMDPNEFL